MDETIARSSSFSVQTALLYTTSSGERRIRTHNYIIPLSNNIADIYEAVDTNALVGVIARTSVAKFYLLAIPSIKNEVIALAKRIYLTALSLNKVLEGITLLSNPLTPLLFPSSFLELTVWESPAAAALHSRCFETSNLLVKLQ